MLKEEIINKGIAIFNGKYDYNLLGDVKTKKEKFPIICPEHGIFYKDYDHHIRRQQGCPECSGKKRYTTEEFISKCQKLRHTSEMSFENTQYVNTVTKIKVYCHHKDNNGNEHGEFEITPLHLLSGEGCPKCRYIKSAASKRRSLTEVIDAANETHNGRYDYSLITEYKNDRIKYPIICPEHGIFYQVMNNHIKGKQGCPECGKIKCAVEHKYTTEEYVGKCKEIHQDKYDYSLVNYISSSDKVTIICSEHGPFEQIARNHLFGQGCPKCFKDKSGIEKELFEYIQSLLPGVEVEENNRTILNGKEIDVYIPSLKLGFEMDGLIWHSDKFDTDKDYHLNKTELASDKGVTLVHIFEDEWEHKNMICKSRIKSLLGIIDSRIFARKCEVKIVSFLDASKFINENHIQGFAPSSVNIGLFYCNELIDIMTFGKKRVNVGAKQEEGVYELIRMCSKLNMMVVGGASKMLSYFIKNFNPRTIITYADRRWSTGGVYEKIGFKFTHTSKPSYSYVVNKKRTNRYTLRKDVLVSKYGCPPEMTEKEFCQNQGWYRIYDCGCLCYKLTPNNLHISK